MPSRTTKNSEPWPTARPRLAGAASRTPPRRHLRRLVGSSPAKSGTARSEDVGLGSPGHELTIAGGARARAPRLGLGGLEEREHPLDVGLARRVVEDAEAERVAAVQAGRGDEAEAALLERGRRARVAVVVESRRAEAHDAERRRRDRARACRSPRRARARAGGEVERAVDRRAERVEPERPQREPELQRARRARQLQAQVGEVDLAVGRRASRR